jgi:hypothetical protein
LQEQRQGFGCVDAAQADVELADRVVARHEHGVFRIDATDAEGVYV